MNQDLTLEQLQYPIGRFSFQGDIDANTVSIWIAEIAALPGELTHAVIGLSDEQLDTPYRQGGWTVRQVVHHIADSHINSLIRFKLALTEDKPLIKTYYEDRWALLPDYQQVPIEQSLEFIKLLHARWVILLRSLSDEDLQREFMHPESGPTLLKKNIGIYTWHGKHHVAHITSLRERMDW